MVAEPALMDDGELDALADDVDDCVLVDEPVGDDHGQTGCLTPAAIRCIERARARTRKPAGARAP